MASAAPSLGAALRAARPLSGAHAASRMGVACASYAQRRAEKELASIQAQVLEAGLPASVRTFSRLSSFRPRWAGGRRAPVRPGHVSPPGEVPASIERPWYAVGGGEEALPDMHPSKQVYFGEDLERMRRACRLAARVLRMAGELAAVPGTTTEAIDRAVHGMIVESGAYPSPLGYGGFPKSVCTSVNEVVCHGIPDDRPLEEGDIVNVDVTVYLDGFHGDTSRTFFVGGADKASPAAIELVQATEEALRRGIEVCGPGVPYRAIGEAIYDFVQPLGFGSVEEFAGHGVGRHFHSEPTIVHAPNLYPGEMEVGETFTIEPMLVARSTRTRTWPDGWTTVTRDGGLTAQAEHSLVVTENGVEILTVCGDDQDAGQDAQDAQQGKQ